MAFTAAVEPLRAANQLVGREQYSWHLVTVDGGPVTASNDISVNPHGGLDAAQPFSMAAVCAGLDPLPIAADAEKRAAAWLRRLERSGTRLGGIGSGAFLLARTGLLDGYRCTIHWENLTGFSETFPEIDVANRLFEVDRDRFTCSGGTASLDWALHMIGQDHGPEVSAAVADQFIHATPRRPDTPQRMSLRQRTGVSHPKLLSAIAEIEANLDEPLAQADLAERVGLSSRQLERLFQIYLGSTPSRYYLEARLKHARSLLAQTSLSVLEVAVASGFASASHFAKCYRELFGYSPRAERQSVGQGVQKRRVVW